MYVTMIEAELVGSGLNDVRIIVGGFGKLQSTLLDVLLTIIVEDEYPRGLGGKGKEDMRADNHEGLIACGNGLDACTVIRKTMV